MNKTRDFIINNDLDSLSLFIEKNIKRFLDKYDEIYVFESLYGHAIYHNNYNAISLINLYVREYEIEMSRLYLLWYIYLAQLDRHIIKECGDLRLMRVLPLMPEHVYKRYNRRYGWLISNI